jgi:hypothetical protein
MLGARESLDAIEPAANALEASTADVMVKELATDAVSTGLTGVEVAALLVRLDLEAV